MSEFDQEDGHKSGSPIPSSTLRSVMLSLPSIGQAAPPLRSIPSITIVLVN